MRRIHVMLGWSLATCFLAALTMAAQAGDQKKETTDFPAVKRGPEHKFLESLVGTYDAKVKLFLGPKKRPVDTTGIMTRTMILHGNFLQESFEGDFFGKSFKGLGLVGYDAGKKKYVTAWGDSMSPTMSYFLGTYDADKKTLTSVGEDIDPLSGKKMKARDLLKIVSADEQYFEMFRQPEGTDSEFKMMEITYTRRKAASSTPK